MSERAVWKSLLDSLRQRGERELHSAADNDPAYKVLTKLFKQNPPELIAQMFIGAAFHTLDIQRERDEAREQLQAVGRKAFWASRKSVSQVQS